MSTTAEQRESLMMEQWRRREAIVRRFEEAMQRGERPAIEDHLTGHALDRMDLLCELIHAELEYRLKAGEPARVQMYLVRHPELEFDRRRLVSLLQVEYAIRRRQEPALTREEFAAHFPQLEPELSTALRSPSTELDAATLPSTQSDESRPARIGCYEVSVELGRGGMGVVYAARDTNLDRDVAIKVLHDKLALNSPAVQRFQVEARITGQLQHPGIPPIHEVGMLPDGRPFLAMKRIKGRTLAAILSDKAVDRGRLVATFEQICQAVAYAHSRGVIHRDLKPANVMVGAFGEVQVMDWGLAKLVEAPDRPFEQQTTAGTDASTEIRPAIDSAAATGAGCVIGTPAYMGSEQARGEIETLDERADVFSLGAILCEVLTGHPPYHGSDVQTILRQAGAGEVSCAIASLRRCSGEPDLVALCERCLAPDPAARPRNAAEIAAAVAGQRAAAEVRARQAELATARAEVHALEERKRRRIRAGLAASVGSLLLFGALAGWWADKKSTERAAFERERHSRNRDAAESLVRQCELALARDNLLVAAQTLDQAETRVGEGGADHLASRLARCRADLALLQELDRIDSRRWTMTDDRNTNKRQLITGWSEAFAQWDLIPGTTPPGEAAQRLNESPVRDRLLTALDYWLTISRSPSLADLLNALDQDEFRGSVRTAIVARDDLKLAELVQTPAALIQPVRFASVLGSLNAIPAGAREKVLAIALRGRAGDFGLLMTRGGLSQSIAARTPMATVEESGEIGQPNGIGGAANAKSVHSDEEVWFRAAIAVRPTNAAAHNNLGLALRHKGDLDGAVAEIIDAIHFDPKSAKAHCNQGVILCDMADYDGAIACFQKAIRLTPDMPVAHFNLGIAQKGKGDDGAAATAFKEAIRLDPKEVEAHFQLGVVLQKARDLDGAIGAFREGIKLDSNDARAQRGLGIVLTLKGDAAGAVAAGNEAVRLDPNNANSRYWLGLALKLDKNLDGAIAAFQAAVRLDPKYVVAHDELGLALRKKGDLDGAAAAHREAIRLNPKNESAHNNLGIVLAVKKDFDGAVAAYRNALRLNPEYAPAHINLGIALQTKNDLLGAVGAYREAIRLDPKSVAAHLNLGLALRDMKDLDGAVTAHKEAIRLDAKSAPAHAALGRSLWARGDLDGAEAGFRNALRLDPENKGYQERLVKVQKTTRDLAACQEAVRLDPKNAENQLRLGNALGEAMQPAAAEKSLREALQLQPTLVEAHFSLGKALASLGRPAEALRATLSGIDRGPGAAEDPRTMVRYNAACCAALCASGSGKDVPPPTDRPTYRQKTFDFLAADLATTRKLLDIDAVKNRQFVFERMNHWLVDGDLKSVRDSKALNEMPADERSRWERLWTNVGELRQAAAPHELGPRPREVDIGRSVR